MMRTILNKGGAMSGLLFNTTLAAFALWLLLASIPH